MNSLTAVVTHSFQHSQIGAVLADAFLKSFVILALAGGVCLCWRRAAASARHLVWLLAVAGVLLMPGLSRVLPSWQRPLWTVGTQTNSENEMTLTLDFAPARDAKRMSTQVSASQSTVMTSPPLPAQDVAGKRLAAHFRTGWAAIMLGVWLGGAGMILLSLVVGCLRLRAYGRVARPAAGAGWLALVDRLCREMGIGRRVTLLQSVNNVMPVTWGGWRPVILLPAEAEGWSPERRRVVLLHELAHVKRWDCITQLAARLACAIFWFNPLVWVAARRMCVERERACDDLVLNGGCKASDYAAHLVEIAGTFRPAPMTGAIAMARSSQLEGRVAAIVDASRTRRAPRAGLMVLCCFAVLALIGAVAAEKPGDDAPTVSQDSSARPWYDGRLRAFFTAKAAQARKLADGQTVPPEVWPYFDAGMNGDWTTATNLWHSMRQRAHQYEGTKADSSLDTVWAPILETELAREQFANWQEKYVLAYGDDIIKSIPPGSIYFGGTDPGRGVITAMQESHADAKPFFTLTQNALADNTYDDYLRAMYGGRIYTPTSSDVQTCFSDYTQDLQSRYTHDNDPRLNREPRQLKPGESTFKKADGTFAISGVVAVMSVNGLITKVIFDMNPDREFYVEESFPLDWMYPHLLPNGLIMKINRQPLASLSDDVVMQDHEYWFRYLEPLLGDWLKGDTSTADVAAFAEKVYLKHDLGGFTGDPEFLRDTPALKSFAKLRTSIAGVYAWRVDHAKSTDERARMTRAADFAYRQAFALCPTSPEVLNRYVDLLMKSNRKDDAILLIETSLKLDPNSMAFQNLLEEIRDYKPKP
jgi:beta-lactamase regulating signal transducer with metallopeptidase domain